MLRYVIPATPDGYNRNRPVFLDKGPRGLVTAKIRKRYLRLKRWWERPPPLDDQGNYRPRVVIHWPRPTQTDDPAPTTPRPFWAENDEVDD